jgi:YjbE family integral membrane protein
MESIGPDVLKLVQIIWINIILSGDNAVVIAMACRGLPADKQRVGMILGAAVAVALRIVFTVLVATLLATPFLKIIGGCLLLWIAVKLLTGEGDEEGDVKETDRLWHAVRTVAIADAVMSLDNVLAIAGAAKSAPPELQIWLIVIGLLISIPLVVFGATLIVTLLTRYPVLVWVGAALLGWIAGELMVSDRIALLQMQAWNPALVAPAPESSLGIKAASAVLYGAAIIGVIIVILSGWLLQKPRHHQGSHGAAE